MAKKKESPKEESTSKPAAKTAKAAAAAKPAAPSGKAAVKPVAAPVKGKPATSKSPEPLPPAPKPKAKSAPVKAAEPSKVHSAPAKVDAPKAKSAPAKPAAAPRPKAAPAKSIPPTNAEEAATKESPAAKPAPVALSPAEARRANSEAQKAKRQAELQAAADAKAAKIAETKAALDAKKAERAAALQEAAQARAAKLEAIRAANAAKIAGIKNAPKIVPERKPAARPERPSKPEPASRPAAKPIKTPEFSLGLSIALHKNWERTMQAALMDGAKVASKQLEGMLKAKSAADPKAARDLENDRRRLSRVVDKGIASALTRLLEPGDLQIDGLQVNADGSRLVAPPKALEGNALAQAKVIAIYRDLLTLLSQDGSGLKAFDLKGSSIVLNYGDSLPGDFFFSGSFKIDLNFDAPSASTVSQDFHLFQKKGKTLGPQLRIGFMHDLTGKNFGGQLSADFPVSKTAL